jgi:serine/threonine-protein kinase
MLSGAPPFTGDSAIELALSHLHDPPPPLPEGVPRALAQIAGRALAKDPRGRYQDGHAMATALARGRRSLGSSGQADFLGPAVTPTSAETQAPAAIPADPSPGRRPGSPEPTRVAPRLGPRRRFNPAARRRSAALLGLAFLLLTAMILGAVLLAPPARVRVPELLGLGRGAIAVRLHPPTLRVAFASRYDYARPGSAIAQRPSPGKRVNEGSTVRVTLSAGPPPVEVPRLVGQASTPARAILGSLGLGARVTAVPAPGVQPGTVTAQAPPGGHYLRPHSSVELTIAETPQWRPLTAFAGTEGGQSVPFRIRGSQWRISYRMAFVGTCTLIFFCDGPSARIVRAARGSTADTFGLTDGGEQTQVVRSGPGLYEIQITPGSDTARWSVRVQDYY